MLDINYIRENIKEVKNACKNKNKKLDIDLLLELDKKRRDLIGRTENIKSRQKKASDIEEAKKLKKEFKKQEKELKSAEKEYLEILEKVPNIPHSDVPIGKNETENVVAERVGEVRKFNFKPQDHLKIGERLGIIDTKKAAKVAGARFNYLKGEAALLEFALVKFVFDTLTDKEKIKEISNGYAEKPFIPVVPPVMIKPEVYKKMGRLFEEDKNEKFYIPKDNLYLAGSAEHTLGPLHINETLEEGDLPLRYVGFSASFRREAGSYGKDTRGILRVHQFDKLEMECFTFPENSRKEQDFLVAIQKYLVSSLEIPFQVVQICTGDMGLPDVRQIDIECWIPSQEKYRETHTADLIEDYQSRRLNTKVKRKDGKEFVHMNDATAFAIGRILIALLENYQREDGGVNVPKVLQKYAGFKEIKPKNK